MGCMNSVSECFEQRMKECIFHNASALLHYMHATYKENATKKGCKLLEVEQRCILKDYIEVGPRKIKLSSKNISTDTTKK